MATALEHTYGAKCRLAPVLHIHKEDGMPPIESQFFYSSLIPIDDPLSTGSIAAGSDARSAKGQLRPFSRGDNNALEKAWLSLMSDSGRRRHENIRRGRAETATVGLGSVPTEGSSERDQLVLAIAQTHFEKHRTGFQPQELSVPAVEVLPIMPASLCCSGLLVDVSEELQRSFCGLTRMADPTLHPDSVVQDVIRTIGRLRQSATPLTNLHGEAVANTPSVVTPIKPLSQPRNPEELKSAADDSNEAERGTITDDQALDHKRRLRSISSATNRSARSRTTNEIAAPIRHSILDDGISGRPFVRVGSPDSQPPTASALQSLRDAPATEAAGEENKEHMPVLEDNDAGPASGIEPPQKARHRRGSLEVAVGISRLHMVSLPMLQMKPIYWSPVNDVAVVMRATWFYRDTMLPVPPVVANQLEAGYQELRPWTETWSDEVRCAIDVGPLGEEKVAHPLWPKAHGPPRGVDVDNAVAEPHISSDPYCAARCFQGEAAAEGSVGALQATKNPMTEPVNRPFSNYHVIYKNEAEAFMLKPSLKPSAYYGRRPLSKIIKGVTIGVPVVRGFDREKWEQTHHRKQAPNKPGVSAAGQSHESSGQGVCPACKADKDRGQVTDLILVAHGIGQKFAERVESFHFTHAINGFRRAVNTELGTPIVQQVLREGQNGLMILPLNWRMGLSFEDGGPMRDEDRRDYTPDGFALKDIEPDTIPAIRSMISDVMFDIPFYMSHHKGKMINALVSEANRVYRLWCRNNPGFAEKGRVHMIGHSLGSAMAIEILSRQPTTVPPPDLSQLEPETGFFEFDTKNLFLVGSPAGFFLLLERGTLIPRRGREKPGADPSDAADANVVGDAGTFGCLAVDNIYNILAKEDPIAYLLNGAVDPTYSSSLKKAYLPSASTTILQSIGDAMRNVVPGLAPADPLAAGLASELERPSTVRLPSQLELEVHDFTREEVAEKKAFLLNDNGQIDWYLRSGGGPLEIQYLNMLSAHTSYWTNHDFIRMLCVEIGRKPGRPNTLPAMRAVKAAKRLMPTA